MEPQGESKIGGFLKGALVVGALAAACVGIGAIAFAAWPIITTSGIGALFSSSTWSLGALSPSVHLAGAGFIKAIPATFATAVPILPTITAAFTGIGGWIAGGAALLGGGMGVAGSIAREQQQQAYMQEQAMRAQSMDSPKLGRDRSQQPDYAAMSEAAGINHDANWQARTGRGQGASAPALNAQPTPRV